MGIIHINNLKVCANIGITTVEQSAPQVLSCNVWLTVPFTVSSQSDAIHDTINYSEVAAHIHSYIRNGSWNLLERLIVDISHDVKKKFRLATRVEFEIRKFVVSKSDYVSVRYATSENPDI